MLADQAEAFFVLRPQRIFEKEEVIGLKLSRQARGLDRRQPLVDVMEQLDLIAQRHAQVLEKARNGA